jgi:hypothetical protein
MQLNNSMVGFAAENIPNSSNGLFLESVINELKNIFNADLSQRIKRGSYLNAEKCLTNGGFAPFGYKVKNKKYVVDKKTAPIVKEIFEKYADNMSLKQICDELNSRNIKSSKGYALTKDSIRNILKNRKYLGIYIYGSVEVAGGIPQIVDNDLFNAVAQKIALNKKTPAQAEAKTDFAEKINPHNMKGKRKTMKKDLPKNYGEQMEIAIGGLIIAMAHIMEHCWDTLPDSVYDDITSLLENSIEKLHSLRKQIAA